MEELEYLVRDFYISPHKLSSRLQTVTLVLNEGFSSVTSKVLES